MLLPDSPVQAPETRSLPSTTNPVFVSTSTDANSSRKLHCLSEIIEVIKLGLMLIWPALDMNM